METSRTTAEPGVRVLIVDDNEDIIEVLVDGLEHYAHDVRSALNAKDALRILEEFRPAVAIIDLGLGGTDGWQLAEMIRAHPTIAPPRLLALTGLSDDESQQRSRAAGFEAHLLKPVRMRILDAKVRGRD